MTDVALHHITRKEFHRAVEGGTRDFYHEHPVPHQLLLVIEVSDSSLKQNLGMKLRIYAGGGIREYWVLDLKRRRILVHTQPQGSVYGAVAEYSGDDSIAPPWDMTQSITVRELLP